MAEGWAKYCLSDLDRRYPKDTNVGLAVTEYDTGYHGWILINETNKTIDGKDYYVKGFNLKSGSKPDVTQIQFESHCRMSVGCNCNYSASIVQSHIDSFYQYKNTYISVFKLSSDAIGYVKIGKCWQSCVMKTNNDVWYYCVAH